MAKKTPKRGGNKTAASKANPDISAELDSMTYWRSHALKVCPELAGDEMKTGELALMLCQVSKAFNVEFAQISRLCDKNQDNKVGFSLAFTLDRRVTPSDVKTELKYSEKHKLTFQAQVPDHNQSELPGMDGKKTSEEGGEGGEAEAPENN